jgi:hypothetical protein
MEFGKGHVHDNLLTADFVKIGAGEVVLYLGPEKVSRG